MESPDRRRDSACGNLHMSLRLLKRLTWAVARPALSWDATLTVLVSSLDFRKAEIKLRHRHISWAPVALVALLIAVQSIVVPLMADACPDGACVASENATTPCDASYDDCADACAGGLAADSSDTGRPDGDCEHGTCAGICACCPVLAPARAPQTLTAAVIAGAPSFPPALVSPLLTLPRSVDHPPCRAI